MKLDTEKKLDNYLRRVVSKSLQEVLAGEYTLNEQDDEQARQKKMTQQLKGLEAPKKKKSDVDEGGDEESPPKKKDEKSEEEGETAVTPDMDQVADADVMDVIDKLNAIRSGKSLKDEETQNRLSDYFDGLEVGEKQSLFVFLTGLSQIMSAGASGEEALDPNMVGIEVDPGRKGEKEEKAEDRVKDAEKKKKGDDAPIVVGEVARKGDILRTVRRLMS